jgi:hypothetical protein
MHIRKVEDGYIVTDKHGSERIHPTLESVFSRLLLHFEGRGKYFGGKSFGVVEIHREPTEKFREFEQV